MCYLVDLPLIIQVFLDLDALLEVINQDVLGLIQTFKFKLLLAEDVDLPFLEILTSLILVHLFEIITKYAGNDIVASELFVLLFE